MGDEGISPQLVRRMESSRAGGDGDAGKSNVGIEAAKPKAKRTHSKTTAAQAVASEAAAANVDSAQNDGTDPSQSLSLSSSPPSSMRRVSGNPAARKKQFGLTSASAESGGGCDTAGVATDVIPGDAGASTGNGDGNDQQHESGNDEGASQLGSSLLSWAANVADIDSSTDGNSDSKRSHSLVSLASGGGVGSSGMSMDEAALEVSQYMGSLSPEKRGSLTVPHGTTTTQTELSQKQQLEARGYHPNNIDGIRTNAAQPEARRQSKFSNDASRLQHISEIDSGDVDGQVDGDGGVDTAAAQRASLTSAPITEEDLRLSSLSMEDLMTELAVDGDDQEQLEQQQQQSQPPYVLERSDGRPSSVERENTEQTVNSRYIRKNQSSPNDSDMTLNTSNIGLRNLAKSCQVMGGLNTTQTTQPPSAMQTDKSVPLTTAFNIPLTLGPPPARSPPVIAAGLPKLVRDPSSGSMVSAGAAASRDHYATFELGVNRIVAYTLAATMTYLKEHFPSTEVTCRDLVSEWRIALALS